MFQTARGASSMRSYEVSVHSCPDCEWITLSSKNGCGSLIIEPTDHRIRSSVENFAARRSFTPVAHTFGVVRDVTKENRCRFNRTGGDPRPRTPMAQRAGGVPIRGLDDLVRTERMAWEVAEGTPLDAAARGMCDILGQCDAAASLVDPASGRGIGHGFACLDPHRAEVMAREFGTPELNLFTRAMPHLPSDRFCHSPDF